MVKFRNQKGIMWSHLMNRGYDSDDLADLFDKKRMRGDQLSGDKLFEKIKEEVSDLTKKVYDSLGRDSMETFVNMSMNTQNDYTNILSDLDDYVGRYGKSDDVVKLVDDATKPFYIMGSAALAKCQNEGLNYFETPSYFARGINISGVGSLFSTMAAYFLDHFGMLEDDRDLKLRAEAATELADAGHHDVARGVVEYDLHVGEDIVDRFGYSIQGLETDKRLGI